MLCVFQVSEVYKLHRETYHLAQDYFDRFMATQKNVLKSMLQLIGITCLFIAAKVEVRSSSVFCHCFTLMVLMSPSSLPGDVSS